MPKTTSAPAVAPKKGDKTPAAKPQAQPVAETPAQSTPPVPQGPGAEHRGDDTVDPAVIDRATDPKVDPAGEKKPPEEPPVDPVIDNPAPNENDAEFVLRIFGVPPEKYMKDGALDRAGLQFDLNTRRALFANRVLHRRSGA